MVVGLLLKRMRQKCDVSLAKELTSESKIRW